MEDNVVFTDEMNEAGRRIFPPCFPIAELLWLGIAKLLGVRDIADRRIKPHVEHFALGAFYRHRNAPIEVAGHSARTESAIEPRLALAVNIRTPLFVVL